MSYTPTEWATGDVITAEKLNNMESGIVGGGGVTVVTFSIDSNMSITCSHTHQEIEAILQSGGTLIGKLLDGSADDSLIALLPMCYAVHQGSSTDYVFDGYQINGVTTLMVFSVIVKASGGFPFTFTKYTLTVEP